MDNKPAAVDETMRPIVLVPVHVQREENATIATPEAAVAESAGATTEQLVVGEEDESGKSNKGAGNTAHRQLKELRSLMPWNWDARIEDHPPGEKAMVDFEDVVNYRYDGRRRGRSLSAVEEVERFKKAEQAKAERESKRLARLDREKARKEEAGKAEKVQENKLAEKKVAEKKVEEKMVAEKDRGRKKQAKKLKVDDRDSNKENVAPASDNVDVNNEDDTMTPAVGRRNKSRSCAKTMQIADQQAVTTPGFVLTPVADGSGYGTGAATVSTTKRVASRNRTSSNLKRAASNDNRARLTAEKNTKNKSRRVTFGSASAQKVTPATKSKSSNRTPKATSVSNVSKGSNLSSKICGFKGSNRAETNRVVNFPPCLTIDLDKYGYGIGIRRPPGCPPLFRAVANAGRSTVPSMDSLPLEMFQVPAMPLHDGALSIPPRVCTPFRGQTEVVSREFVLAQLVQAGVRAAEELGEMIGANTADAGHGAVMRPFELSPKLVSALAQLNGSTR